MVRELVSARAGPLPRPRPRNGLLLAIAKETYILISACANLGRNSSTQPHKVGVSGVRVGGRVVAVIEVQTVALGLEAKALVEEHGWVVHRDMECDILALARLNEMIEHHLP